MNLRVGMNLQAHDVFVSIIFKLSFFINSSYQFFLFFRFSLTSNVSFITLCFHLPLIPIFLFPFIAFPSIPLSSFSSESFFLFSFYFSFSHILFNFLHPSPQVHHKDDARCTLNKEINLLHLICTC